MKGELPCKLLWNGPTSLFHHIQFIAAAIVKVWHTDIDKYPFSCLNGASHPVVFMVFVKIICYDMFKNTF